MSFRGKTNSSEGEYFLFRKASKFISEALIILSSVVGLGSIGVLVTLGIELRDETSDEYSDIHGNGETNPMFSKQQKLGLFVYTILIMLVSASDLIFAIILHVGIRKLKLSHCLFWQGATVTSLLVTGMFTLAFITMVRTLHPMLGYLPSLLAKPFSVWIVRGFISELGELRSFPSSFEGGQIISHPPAKPTFSSSDLEKIKNTTTVFYKNKKFSDGKNHSPYITTTKLKSIPE